MATQQTTPYYHSNSWGAEKHHIGNKLALMNGTIPSTPSDGLGNIIDHVACSSYSIQVDHEHVANAIAALVDYPYPKDLEEFYRSFMIREWDYVAETMLVGVRLKKLVPNEFQRFIIGLYIQEYRPICCCECGLTPGFWCSECFSFYF